MLIHNRIYDSGNSLSCVFDNEFVWAIVRIVHFTIARNLAKKP